MKKILKNMGEGLKRGAINIRDFTRGLYKLFKQLLGFLFDIFLTLSLLIAMGYLDGLGKVAIPCYIGFFRFCGRHQYYRVYMRFIGPKENPLGREGENKYRRAIRTCRYVWIWLILGFLVFTYATTVCVPFDAQGEDADPETGGSFIEAINHAYRNRGNGAFGQELIIRLFKIVIDRIMADLKAFYDGLP